MIRYITAGESHGQALTMIIDGMPAGLSLDEKSINRDLARRQQGYGRSARMKRIEKDTARIISGVRWGETLGSPITVVIENKDWKHNDRMMALEAGARDISQYQTAPRPGHADLAGVIKFERDDIRDILERASARETAARVAAGAICRKLLNEFKIELVSWVISIGSVSIPINGKKKDSTLKNIERSPVRCPHKATEREMISLINKAQREGNTLGGIFEVLVRNVPYGLGSCMQWDTRMDGRLAQALMSIQAVKGVEIGLGFELARRWGRDAHDEILYEKKKGMYHDTNRAGGIEGGMSNGEDIIIRAAMKPISTLARPLRSVDIKTCAPREALEVRSDVCAVPAAGVIGEAVVCIEIAKFMKEKFGGDSLSEMKRNYSAYMNNIRKRFKQKRLSE